MYCLSLAAITAKFVFQLSIWASHGATSSSSCASVLQSSFQSDNKNQHYIVSTTEMVWERHFFKTNLFKYVNRAIAFRVWSSRTLESFSTFALFSSTLIFLKEISPIATRKLHLTFSQSIEHSPKFPSTNSSRNLGISLPTELSIPNVQQTRHIRKNLRRWNHIGG